MFIFIFLSSVNLFSLVLPEKTDALVKDVFEKDGKILKATLIDPTILNSPIGKIKFRGVITFYENGKIKEGELDQQLIYTPIGRVKVEGKVSFYENGKIKEINISEPQKVYLPVGQLVVEGVASFYDNGNVDKVDLSSSQVINTTAGKLKMDGTLYFYPSRKFLGAYLAEHQIINTPLGNLKVKYISFYESRKLKSIQTSELVDFSNSYGSFKVKAYHFYESGKLLGIEIQPQNIKIDEKNNYIVKEIYFYELGNISKIVLDKQVSIKVDDNLLNAVALYFSETMSLSKLDIQPSEVKTKAGVFKVNSVNLYETGTLKTLYLTEPKMFEKINSQIISLSFYETSELYYTEIYQPIMFQSPIGNISIKGFYFDKSGNNIGIELEKPTLVNTPIRKIKMLSIIFKDKKIVCGKIEERRVNFFRNAFNVNYVYFYDSDKIKEVILSKPQICFIGKNRFMVKERLSVYESGKIKGVILYDKVLIDGKEFKANDILIFSEDGGLLGKGKYNKERIEFELE